MTDTAAPVFDLVIPQKSHLVRTWRVRLEDGTYFDFTGYGVRASVRSSFEDDAEIYLEMDEANGYLEVDETRIYMVVPNDITADLDFGAAVWDMVTEDPEGIINRFIQGAAVLDRGVTA